MSSYTVRVEYLSVIRLLLQKKYDTFIFTQQPVLADLIAILAERYGDRVGTECQKQLFILYEQDSKTGKVLGQQQILPDNCLVRIVSMVTGG